MGKVMGSDLLFYEERQKAIERVKREQEKKEEAFNVRNQNVNLNVGEAVKNEENKRYNNYPQNPPLSLSGILGSFKGEGDFSLKSKIKEASRPFENLLDYFGLDSEKLIILMVMWVLFNEKEDKTLLLALGYLLI